MSLQKRFLLQNLLLAGGILAGGALLVARLGALTHRLDLAHSVYSELRTVGHVAVEVGTVHGLLSTPKTQRDAAIVHLNYAIGGLEQFIQVSQGYGDGPDPALRQAYVPINQSAARAKAHLQNVLVALQRPSPDGVSPESETSQALEEIDHVATNCVGFIRERQQTASNDSSADALLAGGFVLLVLLGAIAAAMMQYRLVINPLRRLSRGVRQVTETHFSQRLDSASMGRSREFRQLADEFNRMAAELEHLYQNLEEQVRQKSQELVRSERLASVGFLAAGVAHEINNPLNIISGYAELTSRRVDAIRLRLEDGALDGVHENLRIIQEESFRCKEITEKLLSLSRGGDEGREPLDLAPVVRDIATITSGLKNYRDRRIVLKLDSNEPLEIVGNMTEMKQVLLNLTINALEASEPTGGEVCIEARQNQGWVEVSVKDNGRGMTAQTLGRVFEPFFTTLRGSERGTGLGLSITHAIVESHHGRIEAASDGPGRGSRFTVRLPVRASEPLANGERASTR